MSDDLSEFQIRTLSNVKEIFSEKGFAPPSFDRLGKKEIYFHAKITDKGIDIFIYDDGAQFFGEKVDRRYEAPDYDTLDEMSDDFVKTLDDYLFHPERYSEPKTIFQMIKELFTKKKNDGK